MSQNSNPTLRIRQLSHENQSYRVGFDNHVLNSNLPCRILNDVIKFKSTVMYGSTMMP